MRRCRGSRTGFAPRAARPLCTACAAFVRCAYAMSSSMRGGAACRRHAHAATPAVAGSALVPITRTTGRNGRADG
ncbi:hypothetical protein [Burkholderia pseudomallei]|uniref:hypothetical protein n=1 Tax=Burkholderia pseudomallei TaxID=28450 RepID=UPI0009B1B429|nr:hypothetical protein [Burkholderia pseudomallei]